MKKNYLSVIFILFLLLTAFLSGCALKPAVRGVRLLPTSLVDGDKIGVVVFDYMLCYERKSEDCIPNEHVVDAQGKFGKCVADGVIEKTKGVSVIYSDDLQSALFQNRKSRRLLDEQFDEFIMKQESLEIFNSYNLKYLVLLDVATEEGGRKTTFDMAEDMWGVGRESRRETRTHAKIYDVATASLVGHLTTMQIGVRGYVVPVILIIPLPPVPYSTMTETNTCKAIGNSIGRFLINSDGIENK